MTKDCCGGEGREMSIRRVESYTWMKGACLCGLARMESPEHCKPGSWSLVTEPVTRLSLA